MVEIYVDGTYNRKTGRAGYGFIVYDEDNNILHVQKGNVSKFLSSWQIAAELIGALRVMEWCSQNSLMEFILYFDYLGIEKLATGEYKPKAPISEHYVRCWTTFKNMGMTPIFRKINRQLNIAHGIANDSIFSEMTVVISDS